MVSSDKYEKNTFYVKLNDSFLSYFGYISLTHTPDAQSLSIYKGYRVSLLDYVIESGYTVILLM